MINIIESMHHDINSIKFLESSFTESYFAYSFQKSSISVLKNSLLEVTIYQMRALPAF